MWVRQEEVDLKLHPKGDMCPPRNGWVSWYQRNERIWWLPWQRFIGDLTVKTRARWRHRRDQSYSGWIIQRDAGVTEILRADGRRMRAEKSLIDSIPKLGVHKSRYDSKWARKDSNLEPSVYRFISR